jgi:ABC-type uncharacterized transport system permease subunit
MLATTTLSFTMSDDDFHAKFAVWIRERSISLMTGWTVTQNARYIVIQFIAIKSTSSVLKRMFSKHLSSGNSN